MTVSGNVYQSAEVMPERPLLTECFTSSGQRSVQSLHRDLAWRRFRPLVST